MINLGFHHFSCTVHLLFNFSDTYPSPCSIYASIVPGVIAMAWCPSDSSYLLTCAKDNRTICWDTVTGDVGE